MIWKAIATGGPRPLWLRWLFVVGVATLLTRVVLDSRFGTTAVFYILVPYLIGLLIYIYMPYPAEMTQTARVTRHMKNTLVVMLISSAFLFEGFICVLFAAPIYIAIAHIVLAITNPYRYQQWQGKPPLKATAVPLLVVLLSMEGVIPATSFERENSVTRTAVIAAGVDEIKAKMAEPIAFEGHRPAYLSVFPLPLSVDAGSLETGDVHTLDFEYKRWFVGNTHRGQMELRIAEVSDTHVRTEIRGNDAYFSHYLTVHGTRVDFTPRVDGTTQVSLTVNYRRDLDPAWYFGPLQKLAVEQSADYLIAEVLTP